ncbi:hypothetical protein ALT785_420011 [Alteromonas infernus]
MNVTISSTNKEPEQIKVSTPHVQATKLTNKAPYHHRRIELIEVDPFESDEYEIKFQTISSSFTVVLETSNGLEDFSLDKNEDVPGKVVNDCRTGDRDGINLIRYWQSKQWAVYTLSLTKKEAAKQAKAVFSIIHW